jgi:hypothetical protein
LLVAEVMQIRKSRLLFLGVLIATAVTWYVGGLGLEPHLRVLALQPRVTTAFQDPVTGQSDALLTLICFGLLAPMAAFVVMLVLMFVVRGLEAVLQSIRTPGWFSFPLVGAGVVGGLYATTEVWLPTSLYGLGLVARAYFVYTNGTVPLVH